MQSLNRPYIDEVDQLRGFAAVLVFFYHAMHSARSALGSTGWPVAGDPVTALLWEGHTGVALFFVLSGFILTTGAIGRPIDYWQFMRNRALRIFPLMILVVMFSVYGTTGIDFGQIAASLLLLKNTSAAFSDPAQLAGTVWTVAAEFQLYLVAPFLIAFVGARGLWRFALPLLAIVWVLRMILLSGVLDDPQEMHRISYFTVAGRANQFLIGVALAYLLGTRKHLSRPVAGAALVTGSAGAMAIAWALNAAGGIGAWQPWHVILPELEALVWAVFLAGFLAAKPFGQSVLASAAKQIGLLSFSIYLLHFSIQRQFWTVLHPAFLSDWIDGPATAVGANLVLFGVVLGLSALTWTCVEKPFLGLRKRYLSDRTNIQGAP